MEFIYNQPFRTSKGDVITMKTLVFNYGVEYAESHQNREKHYPDTLTPMSREEYKIYLEEQENKVACNCCCSM